MNYKKRDIKKISNIENIEKNYKENIEKKKEKELFNNNFFSNLKFSNLKIYTIKEIKDKLNSVINLEIESLDDEDFISFVQFLLHHQRILSKNKSFEKILNKFLYV